MKEFQVRQIGTVEADPEAFRFVIHIDEEFRPGLDAVEGFGYVQILFWCHSLDTPEYRNFITCPKPYKKAPDTVGVFATRSPARPNPIALTACPVIGVDREKGTLTVAYIDADNGSPVLDIKPYQPTLDRVREVPVPDWCAHWPEWYEDAANFDWASEFVNAQ